MELKILSGECWHLPTDARLYGGNLPNPEKYFDVIDRRLLTRRLSKLYHLVYYRLW